MANNTYEEVLRFLIEAEGSEDVARLARQLLALGTAGEESEEKVASLLDEMGKASGLSKTADEFRSLGTRIIEMGQKYEETKGKITTLAEEMAAVDTPTRRQEASLKRLTGELERTGTELDKARGTWRQQREVLEANGVATKRYADLQGQIAQKQDESADAMRAYAEEQLRARDAARSSADALEEQDEQFRKQAAASRIAREGLAAYRERAAAAAKETENLTAAAGASVGILDRLKTVASVALGFIGLRQVAGWVRNIAIEGANAEDELGQLQAVLASTGREAEFAGGELQALAEKLAEVSRFSAGEIVNAETRLLSYTNVARSEFPEAMQIVIDQSARLGMSLEQSAEVVGKALQTPTKAMEALGKQGFVLEDSQKALLKQLEATGRTAEAQRIIMDLLVESYGGAAAAQKLNNARGLWQGITESIKNFQQQVADAGALEYFKSQMRGLLEEGKRLAADGTLARWAKNTSGAIIQVAEIVRGTSRFLIEHANAIAFMGKAYAALKIAQTLVALNAWRAGLVASTAAALTNAGAMDANTAAATRLGRAVRAIPTAIKIGVALVGVDLAIKGARLLGETLGENSTAAAHASKVSERMREQLRLEAEQRAKTMQGLAEYRDTAVLTAERVAQLTDEERKAYEQRLAGLRDYLQAQLGYLLRQKEIGLATDKQLAQLDALPGKLGQVRAGYVAIAEGVRIAADAMERNITPAAERVIAQLEGIDRDAKLAAQSIGSLFDGLNFIEGNTLGDVALALAQVSAESAGADRNVRDGLLATLRQLSGEELLRFQSAASAAFAEFKKGPAETAAILDSTLLAAMERLGISAERMGLRFTEVGQDATAAFSTILENANATSAQIETAFSAALSKVATLEEAKALGALLKQAGEDGKVGFDAAERAGAALESRIVGISNALNPLNDQFARLGITSKAELDRAAAAARAAFEAIREGAGKGEAAIEDVRAAFQKYSQAARAAAANSDDVARARVESELQVLEAIYQVNTGLDQMAGKGQAAGSGVASGAAVASKALDGVAASAEAAAEAQQQVADSANYAGKYASKAGDGIYDMKIALDGLPPALIAAYLAMNRFAGSDFWSSNMNRITHQFNEQTAALGRLNEKLDEQIAKSSDLDKNLEKLKGSYELLDEAQLRATAQKLEQLEQARDRARADEEQARAAARRLREESTQSAQQSSGSTSAGGNAPVQSAITKRVAYDLIDGDTNPSFEVDEEQAPAAEAFIDALFKSKAISTRRRRR